MKLLADLGVAGGVAVPASREGVARPYGLVHEENVRMAVPAVRVDLQSAASHPQRPHLQEESVHGGAPWAAVEPHQERPASRAVLCFEEPVEEVRVRLSVDVDVAGVVRGAEAQVGKARKSRDPVLLGCGGRCISQEKSSGGIADKLQGGRCSRETHPQETHGGESGARRTDLGDLGC